MTNKKAAGFGDDSTVINPAEIESIPLDGLKIEKRTLSGCSHTLPIGVMIDGQTLRSFTTKKFTGNEELALSALMQAKKGRANEVAPRLLSLLVEEIGETPVKDLAAQQSLSLERFFQQMNLADALQILLQIKSDNFGDKILLTARCPQCGHQNKDRENEYTDLSTLEIGMTDEPLSCIAFRLDLDPTVIMGDTIDHLILRPSRWYDMTRLSKPKTDRTAYGVMHEIMLMSIVAVPQSLTYSGSRGPDGKGISFGSAEDLYTHLSAKDRTGLRKAAEKLMKLGPEMIVDYICENCSSEFRTEVPWSDLSTFLSYVG
jgi:hypothetical protein